MYNITNNELVQVVGGTNITGSLIASLTRAASTLFSIGQSVGSAVRRLANGRLCPL